MKTSMVGLAFLLLVSSTGSATEPEPEIASQGSGIAFEQCCNDRQPGHPPIFRFDGFATYTTAIAASGDAADIYYPTDGSPANIPLPGDGFPVVVVLQGGRTAKNFYSDYAARIAQHGFIVIVPDHIRAFPPGTPPAALTEASVLNDAFAHVVAEGANSDRQSSAWSMGAGSASRATPLVARSRSTSSAASAPWASAPPGT